MYVEGVTHGRRRAVPSRDLGDDQLQLVEQPGADCRVTRPYLLIVVAQKIADPKMLADREVNVSLGDLEKAGGWLLISGQPLREIRSDAIPVEHRPFLFL